MEEEDAPVVLQQEPVAKGTEIVSDADQEARAKKAFERFDLLPTYNYGTKRLAVEGLGSKAVYPDVVIGCEPLDEEAGWAMGRWLTRTLTRLT
eukprot:CAMPEP_0204520062 /NCGR_PEP_ID=MMETSP0661-20131031/5067_1 /ASSEMBLY_ACC=CAM_ASM_000606 /TAXON_ID=109239 /ORGANISM="Alexandrium margalefi, Strain AMGDE01CS-322" /LENGTH=92 /DNA_ID=CAMNT_0051525599 /DNA_START=62 /DNA_END=337 /DNA_ORIENTATION=-